MTRAAAGALVLLDPEDCYRLIGAQGLAQVNMSRHALPAPVGLPYVVEGTDVLLGTSEHPYLGPVLDGAVVSIDIDAVDPATLSHWHVVLVGPAVTTTQLVRVRPTDVTGFPV